MLKFGHTCMVKFVYVYCEMCFVSVSFRVCIYAEIMELINLIFDRKNILVNYFLFEKILFL